MQKLNNFQRRSTAEWLLNISQAVAVGVPGSLFIPEVGQRVGVIGVVASTAFALLLYAVAMYVGKEVKNDK